MKEPRPEVEMTKQTIIKDDGRYLIYFRFVGPPARQSADVPAAKPDGTGRPTGLGSYPQGDSSRPD
ncbi:MAG: hypothetical protein AB1566_00335 [Chloroflexota bacterium]